MSNPARYLSAALALMYPVTAFIAARHQSTMLTVVAIAVLCGAVLVPSLWRRRMGAWLAVPFIAGGLWWLARTPGNAVSLYAPPVLIPGFLAWVFGYTLGGDRTPLIAQMVTLIHPPGDRIDDSVWPYARRLTLAWTLLLGAIALINLVLAALLSPGGLLLGIGIAPPVSVTRGQWSLFANLIGYLLIAAFFVGEYAYRRRRFPQQPYRNFFDFLRRTIAASPHLLTFERPTAR